ncbi:hypothetical protein CXG81DRAFT_27496 [Caulochytrium protostelioides]|uniref:START domain-containing protein n=1 Tax=Caulochytrium protostelioides TaxID=1555241 RepID=A0A4V1IU93_9FUNG|nr:hypothetical protein CXG81DRAFT_27496 [Caulochytrium protostelioides]|eukprot:RKO99758.1 hypothetical protein CXG81DRAFT_27496 [Caulochytrium protostelioides]
MLGFSNDTGPASPAADARSLAAPRGDPASPILTPASTSVSQSALSSPSTSTSTANATAWRGPARTKTIQLTIQPTIPTAVPAPAPSPSASATVGPSTPAHVVVAPSSLPQPSPVPAAPFVSPRPRTPRPPSTIVDPAHWTVLTILSWLLVASTNLNRFALLTAPRTTPLLRPLALRDPSAAAAAAAADDDDSAWPAGDSAHDDNDGALVRDPAAAAVSIPPPVRPAAAMTVGSAVAMAQAAGDPYIQYYPALEQEFLQYADLDREPEMWERVLTDVRGNYRLDVQKRVGSDCFFRLVADFETTQAEAFDFFGDAQARASWDEVTAASGVVETISNMTKIQYLQTKPYWPTAARDALVMSFVRRLENGGYLNVTRSIEDHPDYVSPPNHVRMEAKIAGQVVYPHPSGDPFRCHLVQLVDGDLKGWLPKHIVAMVTTQAFPVSMRKANKVFIRTMHPRTRSVLIDEAEGPSAPHDHAGPTHADDAMEDAVTSPARLPTTATTPTATARASGVPRSPLHTAVATPGAGLPSASRRPGSALAGPRPAGAVVAARRGWLRTLVSPSAYAHVVQRLHTRLHALQPWMTLVVLILLWRGRIGRRRLTRY